MEVSKFIGLLEGVKRAGKGWIARCPAHDDKSPSLSVSERDGKLLVFCHAGCTNEAIVKALGLTMKDLFSGNGDGTSKGEARPIIATHPYTDAQGRFLFEKVRYATKPKTKPRHKDPTGKWIWGAGDKRPLYRLPQILKAQEVCVTEGEKDADNLVKLGFEATTTPFGKWEPEHAEALKGKDIFIFGDHDRVGLEKVNKAVVFLRPTARSIRIVTLPTDGKPEGYDVSDYIGEQPDNEAAVERLSILMSEAQEPQTEAPSSLPPLTIQQTQIRGILFEEPPEADPILTYNNQPVLTRGVVGGLTASGGAGKTTFLLQMGCVLAGGTSLGPLKAAAPFRVLMLCGEDPQCEILRRLWRIGQGDFPEGFFVFSTAGRVPPLMHLVEGNPARSPAFDWLRATIENHMPLDVLIIDPKSRFYGLDENNNDHATQWVACLEALTVEFNVTVLFSHHVSKQRADSMGQAASRGASALVDGCRWVAGMTRLSDDSAKRYDIPDPRGYVEFDITKSNYAAQLPSKFIFKRTENGLLEYAALEADRRNGLKRALYYALNSSEAQYSRRELLKGLNGASEVLARIKEEFPTFKQVELDSLFDELISDGVVDEKFVRATGAKKPKATLQPIPLDPNNLTQKWY